MNISLNKKYQKIQFYKYYTFEFTSEQDKSLSRAFLI